MSTVSIPLSQCPFEKTNLVTKFSKGRSFDDYKCANCGLKGRRFGVSATITANLHCGKKSIKSIRKVVIPAGVSSGVMEQFGLRPGQVYDVVPIPDDQRTRFPNSTWVMSPTRQEPVRLLAHEFEPAPESER